MLDRELAYWLAHTPGALLTSIGGVGVTLAAAITAELGPPNQWRAVRRLCSYAGVIPRVKQTGGPERQAIATHVQSRCNKRFKNAILQAVEKVCIWGSDDLRQTAQKLEARGAHREFAMAKRLVRLCKNLVATGTVYRPKFLLAADTRKDSLGTYYTELWTRLLKKWQSKADVNDVFASDQPFGRWRDMARELYGLELPLPKIKRAKLTRH